MDWSASHIQERDLVVLVTDLRGHTSFILSLPSDLVTHFIRSLGDITQSALMQVALPPAYDPNNFTGDGFLSFMDPADPSTLLPTVNPPTAINAAVQAVAIMRKEFRGLCSSPPFGSLHPNVELVAGISQGPVVFGQVTGSILERNTGIGRTVILAFRLCDAALRQESRQEHGPIVVSEEVEADERLRPGLALFCEYENDAKFENVRRHLGHVGNQGHRLIITPVELREPMKMIAMLEATRAQVTQGRGLICLCREEEPQKERRCEWGEFMDEIFRFTRPSEGYSGSWQPCICSPLRKATDASD